MPPLRETKRPVISDDVSSRLREIRDAGGFTLPNPLNIPGYGGTGGPGRWMERLLGLHDSGNADIPDSGAWELKTHSGRSLLTLFHQEHASGMTINQICEKWGILTKSGRCFRHTVRGDQWSSGKRISGFCLMPDWSVYHRDTGTPTEVVRWEPNRVVGHLAQKLRRLIYVSTERVKNSDQVLVHQVSLWWDPKVTELENLVKNGVMQVDFDACIRADGSIRNHGTKFRIKPDALGDLYTRHEAFD